MCLRVDPLKDAAGSPFCKADRLYQYLHVRKLYVECCRSTNTSWHISVHYVNIFLHTHKVWDMGWGIHGLNGWSVCGSNGRDSYGYCCQEIWLKTDGLQGSTHSYHHINMGSGPFKLPTHGLLQKGWDHSPPKACFEESNCWLVFTVQYSKRHHYSLQ